MIFTLKHFPYYAQPETEILTELRGSGPAGEMFSLSFSLLSLDSIQNVELSVSHLRGPAGVINADCVNLHVVKVWDQAGLGVYQSERLRVAELLLKDDREELSDGYVKRCHHRRHFFRSAEYYRAPRIRLNGNACTSLMANESKQIWVSLKVPVDASPGIYDGYIDIAGAKCDSRLALRLEVLPIVLLQPERDIYIWYKGTLDCTWPRHYLPEATFRAQLQDIYDHGFRSLSLNEHRTIYLRRALRIAEEIGFDGHAVITPPYPHDFARIKFKRLKPIFYVSDEIDVRGEDSTRIHIENSRRAGRLGKPSMCSLIHHSFTRRLLNNEDIGYAPEVLSYYLPQNLDYFWARSELPHPNERKIYYYWLSHMEKPALHRVLAGIFFWKSKAHGIAPYCYQHLPQPPFSPFNDFDEWEPDFHLGEEVRPFKDHMTTYPAQGGSIPTLQWKGLSDGILDLKYLTTLESAINGGSQSSSERLRRLAYEARQRLEAFSRRIDLKTITITSEIESMPYPHISSEQYEFFRDQMISDIIALQKPADEQSHARTQTRAVANV